MMHAYSSLPDPDYQAEFYQDIPTKRLVAWLADMLVIILICLLIVPFTAFTGLFFFPFLMLIVGFAYRVITLANQSATWGMRLTAIEFRTSDGQPFTLQMAFLHTLGYSVSIAFFLLQVVSIVLMLTTARAQGLTDHFLGTVALNRRARS
ncbi:RDD family protein [Roseovarius sp. EL26]|uniref:RDD family protein n=1 Tax=Roseovarius sp. EL26 TaxID=2126672 RepID=UPI000EA0CA4C|nr:RDD family protein [Roseovarius sp. EL26]